MSNVNISLSASTTTYLKRIREARTETAREVIRLEQSFDKFAKGVHNDFASVNDAINTMLSGLAKVKGGGYVAGVLALGVALATTTNAVHQLSKEALENQKALEKAANQARMTSQELQSYGRVVSSVGIDTEKLGDMSKDVFDRIGEYATTGSGPLKDFFDVVGHGKVSLSELQGLNSVEFLQKVVTEMENAGASGSQMTFVLESLVSDSSHLLPLLENNAEALNKLKGRMDEIAATPLFTQQAVEEMLVLEQNWNTLWDNFGVVAGNKLTGLYNGINDLLARMNNFLSESVIQDKGIDIKLKTSQAMRGTEGFEAYKVNQSGSDMALQEELQSLEVAIEMQKQYIKDLGTRRDGTKDQFAGATLAHLEAELEIAKEILTERKKTLSLDMGAGTTSNLQAAVGGVKGTDTRSLAKELQDTASLRNKANEEAVLHKQEMASLEQRIAQEQSEAVKAELNDQLAARKQLYNREVAMAKEYGLKIVDIKKKQSELENREVLENMAVKHQFATDEDARQTALMELELERIRQFGEKKGVAEQVINDKLNEVRMNYANKKAEDDLNEYLSSEELKVEQAQIELENYQAFLDEKSVITEADKARQIELEEAVDDAKEQLFLSDMNRMESSLGALSSALEEGTAAQKAAFVASKAASLANIVISGQEALAKIDATSLSEPEKATRKGIQMVQTGAQVATVVAQAIGQFHSGTDEVDQTGSYILKQGERVVQETANKDLTNYLASNKAGGSGASVNAPLNIQGDTSISEAKLMSMMVKQRDQIAKMVKMAQREDSSLR